MKIHFWGVRGSIPTPSTADFVTSRYGGNTTCVSVRAPGIILILDGGSGLRTLGLQLAREMPINAAVNNSFGFGGHNATIIARRFTS